MLLPPNSKWYPLMLSYDRNDSTALGSLQFLCVEWIVLQMFNNPPSQLYPLWFWISILHFSYLPRTSTKYSNYHFFFDLHPSPLKTCFHTPACEFHTRAYYFDVQNDHSFLPFLSSEVYAFTQFWVVIFHLLQIPVRLQWQSLQYLPPHVKNLKSSFVKWYLKHTTIMGSNVFYNKPNYTHVE